MVVSALGYSGILSLSQFAFVAPLVFTLKALPQVWRLVTAFFITKPKFAILLDPYFCTHTDPPPTTQLKLTGYSIPVRQRPRA